MLLVQYYLMLRSIYLTCNRLSTTSGADLVAVCLGTYGCRVWLAWTDAGLGLHLLRPEQQTVAVMPGLVPGLVPVLASAAV